MENIFESIKNRKTQPVHPGEVILDILEDIEVSQTQFAKTLGVSRRRVNQIIIPPPLFLVQTNSVLKYSHSLN